MPGQAGVLERRQPRQQDAPRLGLVARQRQRALQHVARGQHAELVAEHAAAAAAVEHRDDGVQAQPRVALQAAQQAGQTGAAPEAADVELAELHVPGILSGWRLGRSGRGPPAAVRRLTVSCGAYVPAVRMRERQSRARARALAAGLVAGLALWCTRGGLEVVAGPTGPLRVALLPSGWQALSLIAAMAGAALGLAHAVAWAGGGDGRAIADEDADVTRPLFASGVLVLPFLPWLADAWPALTVLAGRFALLVWFVVGALTLRAAVLRIQAARGVPHHLVSRRRGRRSCWPGCCSTAASPGASPAAACSPAATNRTIWCWRRACGAITTSRSRTTTPAATRSSTTACRSSRTISSAVATARSTRSIPSAWRSSRRRSMPRAATTASWPSSSAAPPPLPRAVARGAAG